MTDERDDTQAASAAGAGEQEIREQTGEMAHTADEMEHEIEELGSDIQDARKTAAQRQDAPDEPVGEVAGDWEGEASGADQGDDATDSGNLEDD